MRCEGLLLLPKTNATVPFFLNSTFYCMVPFCVRKLSWTGCVLLLWLPGAIFGQPGAPTGSSRTPAAYSLPALIDSAQHHLPVLRQKTALVEAAKAGIRDAKDAYLPASFIGDEVL